MIEKCRYCGISFETDNVRIKYCSSECRAEGKRLKDKEWKLNNPDRHKAAMKRRYERVHPKIKSGRNNALAEDSRRARELGMSYGKYKLMLEMKGVR